MIFFVFYALCLISFPSAVYAVQDEVSLEKPITTIVVAAPEWKGETADDSSGLYFDLLRLVYQPLGIDVQTRVVPFNRVLMLLQKKSIDASVGFYSAETAKFTGWQFYVTPRHPVDTEQIVAVFKKGKVGQWLYPQVLTHKKVAWINGYGFEYGISVEMDFQKIADQKQGWKLLQKDRIDFYLDSKTDALEAASQSNIDISGFQFEIIREMGLYVPFVKTSKGYRLRDLFDRRMEELRNSEALRQLYSKWGKELPPVELSFADGEKSTDASGLNPP